MEGCHLGGIIGIPWPGSEAGFGVLFATTQSNKPVPYFNNNTGRKQRALTIVDECPMIQNFTDVVHTGELPHLALVLE
jgi:hypothetical protein